MFKTLLYCMDRSFLGNCDPAKSLSVPPALAGADVSRSIAISNCSEPLQHGVIILCPARARRLWALRQPLSGRATKNLKLVRL